MTSGMNGYKLGPNEALGVGSINRVLEHLLANDEELYTKLSESGFKHSVVEWRKSTTYHPGDVVCYVGKPKQNLTIGYLLACCDTTSAEPLAVLRNDLKELKNCGWKLIHETTAYLNDSDLLKREILEPAAEQAIDEHEENKPHFGRVITKVDDFANIFLKNDLSNFTSAKTMTGTFTAGSRLTGEYDEQFKKYTCTTTDGVTELEMTFSFDTTANQDIEILNSRYYYERNTVKDKSDAFIFGSYYGESNKDVELSNGLLYKNIRMPGTNVFSTTLKFPVTFTDTTYMLFPSSYLTDQFIFGKSMWELTHRTEGNNASFVGSMMFMNKTTSSVTVVLPIHVHFAQYGQYTAGLPWVNEFKVTVVGVTRR